MARPVVLVHGAWHGAWCWQRVTPHLDRAGVTWVAPDLPSVGRKPDGDPRPDDVETVLAAIDALPGGEPVVLVGHSRGGLVISEAGVHERVGHLVYLAGIYLTGGETSADLVRDSELLASIDVDDDGWSLPRTDEVGPILYNDCDPDDSAWACERLRHQDMSGVAGGASQEAWRHRATTYVVCELDLALPATSQRRLADRLGGTILSWPTGHSPFLNRPELVAALLVGLSVG